MRLALLVCGVLPPALLAAHGDYRVVFNSFFADSSASDPFTLDPYDVAALRYPSDDDLPNYDAIVITGSAASAYQDIEWINNLVSFIARTAGTYPLIKIIGICFGHQIVARAMGEQVVRNDGRWEVGPTLVTLTEVGKAIFGVDSFYIQEMHQDHVPSVPTGFHLLGSTPISANQGMVRFHKDKSPSSVEDLTPSDIHILTLQGHPEFTEPIVSGLIEIRAANGIIDKETANDGLARRHWANDGVAVIGRSIWNVLGLKA